jgi:hypothetical protein
MAAEQHSQPVRFDGKSERDILIEMWFRLDGTCSRLEEHDRVIEKLTSTANRNARGIAKALGWIGGIGSLFVVILGAIMAHILGGKP